MIDTLIVLAKQPLPGRVKTRLTPTLTPEQAADIAAASLTDTLDAVAAATSRNKVLAFDGDPSGWLRPGWIHARQVDGELDRRIVGAFGSTGPGPALLVGMDTPQLSAALLAQFDPSRYDACLGPATDGGYWAIGFRDPHVASSAILGIPMSSETTYAMQLQRLRELGLHTQLLGELRDVDTIDDAWAVAALAQGTTFAAALAGVDEMVA